MDENTEPEDEKPRAALFVAGNIRFMITPDGLGEILSPSGRVLDVFTLDPQPKETFFTRSALMIEDLIAAHRKAEAS